MFPPTVAFFFLSSNVGPFDPLEFGITQKEVHHPSLRLALGAAQQVRNF